MFSHHHYHHDHCWYYHHLNHCYPVLTIYSTVPIVTGGSSPAPALGLTRFWILIITVIIIWGWPGFDNHCHHNPHCRHNSCHHHHHPDCCVIFVSIIIDAATLKNIHLPFFRVYFLDQKVQLAFFKSDPEKKTFYGLCAVEYLNRIRGCKTPGTWSPNLSERVRRCGNPESTIFAFSELN